MRKFFVLLAFSQTLVFLECQISDPNSHYVRLLYEPSKGPSCLIAVDEPAPFFRGFRTDNPNEVKEYRRDAAHIPGEPKPPENRDLVIEIYAKQKSLVYDYYGKLCKKMEKTQDASLMTNDPSIEIKDIARTGNPNNRIDVVLMAEGYQAQEKQKFYDDASFLFSEAFKLGPFQTLLPLMNIWTIFNPSAESGIGWNDTAKNTAYGAFREGQSLRGIRVKNVKRVLEVCKLIGPAACDHPVLICNEDLYGGIGGLIAVTTRSRRNGTMVLRHELGHNFIEVGEEYDFGFYFGVNTASNISNLGWDYWLTDPNVKEQESMARILDFPWADLANGPKNYTFVSDGKYKRWELIITVTAAGERDCLEIKIDNTPLKWETTGSDDRDKYTWNFPSPFGPGNHTFSVSSKTVPSHPKIKRMLGSVNLYEYGPPARFHSEDNFVSAYPVWDTTWNKNYRPTYGTCLMRNLERETFCPVCKEGLWIEFLKKVSIIDSIEIGSKFNPNGTKTVTVHPLKVGPLREVPIECEELEIHWLFLDVEVDDLRDKFVIQAECGEWTVRINFKNPEIRYDPNSVTIFNLDFMVM